MKKTSIKILALLCLSLLLAAGACSDDTDKPADAAAKLDGGKDKALAETSPDTKVLVPDQATDKKVTPDATSAACGKVTHQGCCDGETVWYCESGKVRFINCTGNPKCGWNSSQSYYDCGTSGSSDPSGTYPKSCAGSFYDAGPPPTDGMFDGTVKKDKGAVEASTPDKSTTKPEASIQDKGAAKPEASTPDKAVKEAAPTQ